MDLRIVTRAEIIARMEQRRDDFSKSLFVKGKKRVGCFEFRKALARFYPKDSDFDAHFYLNGYINHFFTGKLDIKGEKIMSMNDYIFVVKEEFSIDTFISSMLVLVELHLLFALYKGDE
ncbi:hypothetical protein DB313_06075 (plasmid) [Borrelia turcica IST7]|uniref:Uncharacterized protein n=1 Tax=Borrelia turcica IST7 TaxID=1104446 RepID=A0A386PPM4_9SPIR|nr:hypothetical protein [Borrelia turcica]AYE37068.1 hypothetical protein DB313_06075 [Borrelia turcica IST7]